MITAKFGGSSLADADCIRRVRDIVFASEEPITHLVVSAPGRAESAPEKVTDLLLEWQRTGKLSEWKKIVRRVTHIREALTGETRSPLTEYLEALRVLGRGVGPEFAASRGEYMSARLIAEYFGWDFIDAADFVVMTDDGICDIAETERRAHTLRLHTRTKLVIPGYYGVDRHGRIRTFSRGGSDITGSIVARCTSATRYENWTDVAGIMSADPRIVPNAHLIPEITHRELRELSYMGFTVFHDEALMPLIDTNIPVHIRNTFDPSAPGTLVAPRNRPRNGSTAPIVGVAGKKDFGVLYVEKPFMNQEIGFLRKVADVFERRGVSIEHMPSGIDTLNVVVRQSAVERTSTEFVRDILQAVRPNIVEYIPDMALLCVVGQSMAQKPGMAARIFTSLARAPINVRMIDQGSSEISIVIGVHNDDFERAVRAIHDEFFPPA